MSWVFGYGSLMWRPGFSHVERRPALLRGHSRAFCRLSFRHRGTPEAPGMVVGLSPGGSCLGVAYRFAREAETEVLDYLDDREGAGYRRVALPITLDPSPGRNGHNNERAGSPTEEEPAESWVYLPEPGHPSYAPDLPEARVVELIATGEGKSGAAHDYLRDLIAELARLGLEDPALRTILQKVKRRRAAGGAQEEGVEVSA